MVTSNGLLRIFWPNGLPRTATPGVIVGWRNSDYDLFVVTVLEDVEVGCLHTWKELSNPLADS